MSDSTPTTEDFLRAESVVDHLAANLAIQFQIEVDSWDRDTAQKHVNDRAALIRTKFLLLNEAERLLKL